MIQALSYGKMSMWYGLVMQLLLLQDRPQGLASPEERGTTNALKPRSVSTGCATDPSIYWWRLGCSPNHM